MPRSDPAALFGRLQAARISPDRSVPPGGPGVYALFARMGDGLPGIELAATGLVYIGQSGDLVKRNHFIGPTGRSTVRRSLGAILKESLRLTAVPRGRGKHAKDATHYRFTSDGERRLSAWMAANLEIAALADSDPKGLEARLIRHCEPPLCLVKWSNPQAGKVRRLRRLCREEAAQTIEASP